MVNTSEQIEAANVVSKTLLFECRLEQAFRVFTDRMGSWWPASHHIGSGDLTTGICLEALARFSADAGK